MLDDRLASAVRRLPAPWRGHYVEVVDSTQDEARASARVAAPDRSLFLAECQRAGRGRQGRTWLAEPGVALLMSIVFRERAQVARPWRFTSLVSLALVRAVDRWLSPENTVAIKWPNDVMLGDRKVAGVLAETREDGRELIAIVGVGVNVSAAPPIPGATCLGPKVDRGDLLLAFVDELDALRARPAGELHRLWASRLWRHRQRVHLLELDRDEEVVILGVDCDGSLRVQTSDGTQRTTSTGELLA